MGAIKGHPGNLGYPGNLGPPWQSWANLALLSNPGPPWAILVVFGRPGYPSQMAKGSAAVDEQTDAGAHVRDARTLHNGHSEPAKSRVTKRPRVGRRFNVGGGR